MTLYFHRIQKSSEDLEQIYDLYMKAFPEDERVPWPFFIKRASKNYVDFWTIRTEKEWVGFAYLIKDQALAYLFYLAVAPELRGRGFGHKIIAALKEHYQDRTFFLAREMLDPAAENYEERVKRHQFYLSCGLKDLPGHIKEYTVVYDIMGSGGPVEAKKYKKLMDRYAGPIGRWTVERRILE